ncbi:MAG: CHAT domain-containing protein [Cyanobacteriota bacterium]
MRLSTYEILYLAQVVTPSAVSWKPINFCFLMPMSNLDERSHKLIRQLLQSPSGSSECDQEMEQLLAIIPRLPGLRKDPHPDYLQAVNQTLEEVKRKFPDFQRFARKKRVNLTLDSPTKVRQCFVWWVNQFLKFDILDLYRQSQQPLSLDARFMQGIHSSHHASSRLDNPLESALQLGDGVITLGQLLSPSWRLPNLSEVFLSCCETNLGLTPITDDLLTLATGFLCAGAKTVISTLWAVDDLATALFSICYYQQRRQGNNRAVALQQAQQTLRQLTGETFKSVYRPQLEQSLSQRLQSASQQAKDAQHKRDQYPQDSPEYQSWEQEREQYKKLAQLIYNAKTRLKHLSQAAYPFADPFYWAAFTCQGLH